MNRITKRITLVVALSLVSLVGVSQLAHASESERAKQRAAEAEMIWQKIAREQPQSAEAHFNLGIALGRQGRWSEAIAAYQTAIKLQPGQTAAYLNLGRAFTETRQLQAAKDSYQAALRLDPGLSLAQERLNELKTRGGSVAVNEK